MELLLLVNASVSKKKLFLGEKELFCEKPFIQLDLKLVY